MELKCKKILQAPSGDVTEIMAKYRSLNPASPPPLKTAHRPAAVPPVSK